MQRFIPTVAYFFAIALLSHGARAASRFTPAVPVANQAVVSDAASGLVWQRCAAGISGSLCQTGAYTAMDWATADTYCTNLTWGGYSDWYLPDVNELISIVNYHVSFPAIDSTAFPTTPQQMTWASTASALRNTSAWYTHFGSGYAASASRGLFNAVRCVRRAP